MKVIKLRAADDPALLAVNRLTRLRDLVAAATPSGPMVHKQPAPAEPLPTFDEMVAVVSRRGLR